MDTSNIAVLAKGGQHMRATRTYLNITFCVWALNLVTPVLASEVRISSRDATAAINEVKAYVADSRPSAHTFKLFDLAEGKDVILQLESIHADDIRPIATNLIAVCAEFLSEERREYMLWFIIKKGVTSTVSVGGYLEDITYPSRMQVNDILIHKVDGKARIEWVKNPEDNSWIAKPIGMHVASADSHDHNSVVGEVDSSVCPTCESKIAKWTDDKPTYDKQMCPSCKKTYRYRPAWYFDPLLGPMKKGHVCDRCESLVELCAMCRSKM